MTDHGAELGIDTALPDDSGLPELFAAVLRALAARVLARFSAVTAGEVASRPAEESNKAFAAVTMCWPPMSGLPAGECTVCLRGTNDADVAVELSVPRASSDEQDGWTGVVIESIGGNDRIQLPVPLNLDTAEGAVMAILPVVERVISASRLSQLVAFGRDALIPAYVGPIASVLWSAASRYADAFNLNGALLFPVADGRRFAPDRSSLVFRLDHRDRPFTSWLIVDPTGAVRVRQIVISDEWTRSWAPPTELASRGRQTGHPINYDADDGVFRVDPDNERDDNQPFVEPVPALEAFWLAVPGLSRAIRDLWSADALRDHANHLIRRTPPREDSDAHTDDPTLIYPFARYWRGCRFSTDVQVRGEGQNMVFAYSPDGGHAPADVFFLSKERLPGLCHTEKDPDGYGILRPILAGESVALAADHLYAAILTGQVLTKISGTGTSAHLVDQPDRPRQLPITDPERPELVTFTDDPDQVGVVVVHSRIAGAQFRIVPGPWSITIDDNHTTGELGADYAVLAQDWLIAWCREANIPNVRVGFTDDQRVQLIIDRNAVMAPTEAVTAFHDVLVATVTCHANNRR